MEETGLERTRPESRIAFSRPQGYIELLEHVKIHGFHLMQERGELLEIAPVAEDWYDRVYLPTVDAIHRERLSEAWPQASDADLFLWVSQRRRELFPERPDEMDLEDSVRAARHSTEPTKRRPRVRS